MDIKSDDKRCLTTEELAAVEDWLDELLEEVRNRISTIVVPWLDGLLETAEDGAQEASIRRGRTKEKVLFVRHKVTYIPTETSDQEFLEEDYLSEEDAQPDKKDSKIVTDTISEEEGISDYVCAANWLDELIEEAENRAYHILQRRTSSVFTNEQVPLVCRKIVSSSVESVAQRLMLHDYSSYWAEGEVAEIEAGEEESEHDFALPEEYHLKFPLYDISHGEEHLEGGKPFLPTFPPLFPEESALLYPEEKHVFISDGPPQKRSITAERALKGIKVRSDRFPFKALWTFGMNVEADVVYLENGIVLMGAAHFGVVYNYQTEAMKFLPSHIDRVTCLCGKGSLAATSSDNGLIVLWNWASAKAARRWNIITQGRRFLRFSDDEKYLAFGLPGAQLRIQRWTLPHGSDLAVGLLPNDEIRDLVFNSANSEEMLIAMPRKLNIMRAREKSSELFQTKLRTPKAKDLGEFTSCAFTPKLNQVVASTTTGKFVVWSNTGAYIKSVRIERTALLKMQLINGMLVSISKSGMVWFHDQSLKILHWYHLTDDPITSISFDHKTTSGIPAFVYSCGGRAAFVNPAKAEYRHLTPPNPAFISSITCTENKLVSGDESGRIAVYCTVKKQLLIDGNITRCSVSCIKFSPDGQILICGFTNGSLYILNPMHLICTQYFENAKGSIDRIEFTSDGKRFLFIYGGAGVQMMKKTLFWSERGKLRGHCKEIKDISIINNRGFAISDDRYMTVYNLKYSLLFEHRIRIEDLAKPIACVAHKKFLYISNSEHNIRIWNGESLEYVKTVKGVYTTPMEIMHVYGDLIVFSGSTEIGIGQLPFVSVARTIRAHPKKVTCMAACGEYVFVSGENSTEIIMWQIFLPKDPPEPIKPPKFIEDATSKIFGYNDSIDKSCLIDNLRSIGYFPTPLDEKFILKEYEDYDAISEENFLNIYSHYKSARGATIDDIQQAFLLVAQGDKVKTEQFISTLGNGDVKEHILKCLYPSEEREVLPSEISFDFLIESIIGIDSSTIL